MSNFFVAIDGPADHLLTQTDGVVVLFIAQKIGCCVPHAFGLTGSCRITCGTPAATSVDVVARVGTGCNAGGI